MLLKSGGNQFHGAGSYAYSSEHTESDNIDDTLRSQGITEGNPLLSRTDQGVDLGGRIVRDKLWFYTSGRYRPQDVIQLGTYKPDGTPGNGYKAEILLNRRSRISRGSRPGWCSGTSGSRSITTPTR
jgi:hypothetical protein